MIAEERESTFPAYIPADRLIIEHIAKYPSFPGATPEKGHNREVHLRKYGLDEDDFAIFHEAVRQDHGGDKVDDPPKSGKDKPDSASKPKKADASPESAPEVSDEDPKSDDSDKLGGSPMPSYHRIGAWMVNYQEARLLELTRRYAAECTPPMILIYRDAEGNLSRDLPPTSTMDAARFAVGKKMRDVQVSAQGTKVYRQGPGR